MITSSTKTDAIEGSGSPVTIPPETLVPAPGNTSVPPSKKVTLVEHPLAQHALTALRNKHTLPHDFRTISNQLLVMLLFEATRALATRSEVVPAPSGVAHGRVMAKPVVLLTITRHSLGLAHRMADFFPNLLVGTISFETARGSQQAEARLHLPNAPALSDARVILFDPILATGASSKRAVHLVRRAGASDIGLVSFIASAPGLAHVVAGSPDLLIWTVAIDSKLDPRQGPQPGLGNFAERLYG